MYIYSVHFQKHKAQLQIRDWIHYNQITSKCFFVFTFDITSQETTSLGQEN